jgi:glycerophosphoryl diester phosphodiesterase
MRQQGITVFGHGSEEPGNELNSRASFQRLARDGIEACELDVRRTADDVLVVHHDPVLADGRSIRDAQAAEISQDLPTLAEVLDICRGMLVNIEIKNYSIDPGFDADERVTDLVLDLIEARGNVDRVMVSSFGPACLRYVRQRRSDIPTATLLYYAGDPDELLDAVVAEGNPLVHPFEPHVDDVFMEAARARGLGVNVWMGREGDRRLQRLIDLGVDGIITGHPTALRQLLDR